MSEAWKDIIGYEGLYQVSDFGRIKSLSRLKIYSNGRRQQTKERILIPQNRIAHGLIYKKIDLTTIGEVKQLSIHRLVAFAFKPNPKNKPCVNHLNGDTSDNRAINLEWCTHQENSIHWVTMRGRGRIKKAYKECKNKYMLSGFCNDQFADLLKIFNEILCSPISIKYGAVLPIEVIEKMRWKQVAGYEGFYIISEFGHVGSLPRLVKRQNQYPSGKTMLVKGQLIRQHISIDRYQTPISKNGVYKKLYPHQLVARVFIKNYTNSKVVNHKDGNPLNNHYSNLELTSQSQNQLHSYSNELRKKKFGSENCRSKKVEMIDEDNNVLRIFGSTGDIHRELGYNRASISNVCNGNKNQLMELNSDLHVEFSDN